MEFDNSLIDHLADVGYQPEFGARELRSQIRSLIETRLASAVLRGDIEEGDSLRFVYDDDRSEIRTSGGAGATSSGDRDLSDFSVIVVAVDQVNDDGAAKHGVTTGHDD